MHNVYLGKERQWLTQWLPSHRERLLCEEEFKFSLDSSRVRTGVNTEFKEVGESHLMND